MADFLSQRSSGLKQLGYQIIRVWEMAAFKHLALSPWVCLLVWQLSGCLLWHLLASFLLCYSPESQTHNLHKIIFFIFLRLQIFSLLALYCCMCLCEHCHAETKAPGHHRLLQFSHEVFGQVFGH